MIDIWVGVAVWLVLLAIDSWVSYRFGYRVGSSHSTRPVCGCGHHRSQHVGTGKCAQWMKRKDYDVGWPSREWVACPCQGYIGPEPTPEFLWPHVSKEAKR